MDGRATGAIGRGLAVLLGVAREDGEDDARLLADKVAALRVFEDAAGKMNLALAEVGRRGARGLAVHAPRRRAQGEPAELRRRGRRRSAANALYERFCAVLREKGLAVGTGVFRATMEVELVNDGPVTILLDSRRLF